MGLSQRRSRLVGRLRHRKTREREGLVLVEGVRAVAEALDAGAEPTFAVVSPRLEALGEGRALLERLDADVGAVERADDATLSALADTESPQGVLLVCAQPRTPPSAVFPRGRYVVLDAIQDPGNVGTLVRAATAFALDGVLALDGTADPWGAKAVRASAGMVFRQAVLSMDAGSAAGLLAAAGVPLVVADAGGSDIGAVAAPEGWALVVGNEGAGPREALRASALLTVRIPMPGPAESLNAGVAGSILLYALTREVQGAR